MFPCSFRLFCVVGIILCISFFAGISHSAKCVEAERQVLLKLKAGFLHGREVLSSWKGEDCCKWQGISCDNLTDHVTTLDLECFYYSVELQGKLDSSICELQHLTSLNLSYNLLEGKIPECIGSLGHLIELQLGSNRFVGVIPPSLGNLSHLQTLQLEGNSFVGVIPSTLGNLSNLQTLQLGYSNGLIIANDLEWVSHLSNLRFLDLSSGNLSQAVDWLSSISKIPSLSELNLNDCGLPQVNPKSIPHMNSSTSFKKLDLSDNNLNTLTISLVPNVSKVLTYLDLMGNELGGILPESFQSLCQLQELQLDANNLSGQLSDNIQQLRCAQKSLEVLDLGNNPFSSGPLPDFSWLSSLRTLYLPNTNIIGSFPHSLGHMPHLESLDLSYNRLNGVHVINATHLPNLSSLDLTANELSGSLPFFEVTKLSSLVELHLSLNQLNGSLPLIIGKLSNLSVLHLFSNKLNGSITQAHLSNLSRLVELQVANNSLSFNLSSNWVPPFQLDSLDASSCILGPQFPTWLKHQRELTDLDISNAGISDSLPKWFWDQFSSLKYLNVSYNKLSGTIPKSVESGDTTYPGIWDFSFNNLSGPLPNFPKLRDLFLSNNKLSGSLSSFCASSSLELIRLDLSSNLLEGSLLNCGRKFQNIQFLNLAKNNLSGRIPRSFGTLQQMVSLHLNNNNFSSEIPSMAHCTYLTILDLGDNNLQGTVPAWIGHHLHHLVVLSLRANKLQRRLPGSLCNLPLLQVLDLSQNNITGEISQCLNHIIALSNVQFPRSYISQYESYINYINIGSFDEKATLAWKGEDREYGDNLGLMTTIDLSCNHLIGDIPQSITKLVALAGLNLSRNHLTGFIPNNIGQMERLESLDLSRNNLYGRMPESFSNLSFLDYMNLSFNNLSGKIPLGTQLQSFDASTYLGNNELCGPPLTNHCPGDMDSSTRAHDKHATSEGEDEDEDELITFGFYVSLGLGFSVGFWGVFGTLVIKTSLRHSYFRFFHNMKDQIHVKIVVFIARMKRG